MASGDSIKNGAGNPPCLAELDIAVQVTGLQHTNKKQHQSLKLQHYSQYNQATSARLSAQKNQEICKTSLAPSTVFKWDKKAQTPPGQTTKLILEIESEKGTIQLPLTNNFISNGSNPTVDNYYLTNRVYAIVPMTNVAITKGQYKPNQLNILGNPTPVAPIYSVCRTGYFYIFVEGKLWRELFISRDDNGNNVYQDINLADYLEQQQDGSYRYKNGARTPIGLPLTDIWVPGAFYGSASTSDIRMAYSDTQLSTERIHYLEKEAAKRIARTSEFKWLTAETNRYNTVKIFQERLKPQPDKAFPVFKVHANAAPNLSSRPRDELIELLIDSPSDFLHEKDYISNAYKLTKGFNSNTKQGKYSLVDQDNVETSALHYLLLNEQQNLTQEQQQSKEILAELWDNPPAYTNIMDVFAERGIWGILVDDPNYQLIHHKARIQSAINVYPLLAERAKTADFHTLASYIEKQRTVIEAFDKGIKDGIGGTATKAMTSTYAKALSHHERKQLSHKIKKWQKQITHTLAKKETKEVLADMLSNYDSEIDLAGHYHHCVENLFLACIAEEKYDPFAPPKVNYKYEDYQQSPEQFIFDIYSQVDDQLHNMLWPKVTIQDIEKEQQPIKQQPNKGDGLFNPGVWDKIAKNDSLNGGTPTTFNGVTLMGVRHYSDYLPLLDDNHLVFLKNTSSLLYNMLDKLQYIVDRVTNAALNSRQDWIAAIKELNKAEQEYHTKRKELTQAAIKEQKAENALEKYYKKVEANRQKLQHIADSFDQQLEKAMVAKAKISVKNMSLLRIFSGGKFYNLQFSAVTNVPLDGTVSLNDKKYRILGMVNRTKVNRATTKKMGNKFELLMDNAPLTNNGKQTVYLALMPDNDPYVKIRDKHITEEIPQAEKHIAKTNKAIKAVENQLVGLTAAREMAETKKLAAAQTIHDASYAEHSKFTLFKGKAIAANSMERIEAVAQKIYKTGMVPSILLTLEIVNVTRIASSFNTVKNNRNVSRAFAGFAVAGSDMIMAGVVIAEQLQAQGLLFAKQVPIQKTLESPSKFLMKIGLKGPVRLIPMGILAIANIGLSCWDAMTAQQRGDTGGFIGNLVLAGAGAAMLFGLYAGKSSPVLGFGPVGWFLWAVGLTVAGFLILFKFADSELEQWFKQGPFGLYQKHPLLQSESDAFAVLLNLMTRPEIVVTNNPYQQTAQQKQLQMKQQGYSEQDEDYLFIKNIARANTCITITTGFLNSLENDVALRCQTIAYRSDSSMTIIDIENEHNAIHESTVTYTPTTDALILHHQDTANGRILFAYTPKGKSTTKKIPAMTTSSYYNIESGFRAEPGKTKIESESYLWLVAVQVQTTLSELAGDNQVFYFPAPHFTEMKPYNELLHGQPTLVIDQTHTKRYHNIRNTIKQDYWLKDCFLTGAITYDAS